jgi:MOSC domain-containing protein YiiM
MELISVNIGKERIIKKKNYSDLTGIYKLPVQGPVRVTPLGLEGDFIASKKHHGGPDQAIYIYGLVDYEWWSHELGRDCEAGIFGENLTISGLESSRFNIGDQLHIGTVILEITSPRMPCENFAARMEDPQFVMRFRQAERPGLYCRVLNAGTIKTGDKVNSKQYHGEVVTLLDLFRIYYEEHSDQETLRRILNAPIAIRARKDLEERLMKQ